MQAITLPWITWIDPQPIRVARDVSPIAGVPLRTDLGQFTEVEIRCDGLSPYDTSHAEVIRRLRSFSSYAQAGGIWGFSIDHDKSVGYFTTTAISNGGTVALVRPGDQALAAWSASAALVSGDEVKISNGNPNHKEHFNKFSSVSGTAITLSDGIDFDFQPGAFLRYEGFWPVMMLAEEQNDGRPLVFSARRLEYRLTLIGLEYPAMCQALSSSGELVVKTGQPKGGSSAGISLDRSVMYTPTAGSAEGSSADTDNKPLSRWFT